MNYLEKYNEWLNDPAIDEETKEELRSIKDDESEIQDRFYKDLEFGTAGLRGVIGNGSNRMNKYTVTKATQGLANYIKLFQAYFDPKKLRLIIQKTRVLQSLMIQDICLKNLVNLQRYA